MDPLIAILLAVATLVAGLFLGSVFASRPMADMRDRLTRAEEDARRREDDFKQAIKELGESRLEVARLQANAENFDKQIAQMAEAREELLAQFKATGGEVLAKAQEAFLQQAEARLGHSEKASEEKLKALLAPVGDRLKSYEEQVQALETRRSDAFASLHTQIEAMRLGQEEVKREAQRLGNSLRNAPKARGRWGEQQLKNVLEQCGLGEHTDFVTEVSVESDDGRLRPDAIVRVPGNKFLIIDAKVSLNDYQDAFEAETDEARARYLDRHLASMKAHIQALGSKRYQAQFDEAPDYVVMFVPGEHFISAALEHDAKRRTALGEDALLRSDDLWNFAFNQRVLLASPTNLVAIARTVAQVWRQDKLALEAVEIGKAGAELYDRLAKVTEDLAKMGTHLSRAVGSYNEFARSFDARVLPSAKRMRDKGIEIGKREIENVPLVEAQPRYGAADVVESSVRLLDGEPQDEAAE
ncbi:MAG: DNA recombination protein RmuC [Alteraurantiacibacter sp.]